MLQPMTFFSLLFYIYLLWSNLRCDGTTGEEFVGEPEEVEQSIEWNPKSYVLLPLDDFIRH